MSSLFAHGWALPFLAAAALPLLLYLIYRWRRRNIRWGAMRFLLAARSETRRRFELRHFVMIALRTLLAVLVVLAFARPSLRGAAGLVGEHKSAVVLLVDASYSMGCRTGPQTRLTRALDMARALVSGLKPGDEVTALSFGARPRTVVRPPADRESALRAIAGIRLTDEAADLEAALEEARSTLAASPAREKALVIFSDFQKADWQPRERSADRLRGLLTGLGSLARVVLADAGDDGASNVSLIGLEREDPVVARGMGARLKARVANRTAAEKQLPVQLTVEGLPPLSETVTVPARGEAEASFLVSFPEAGWRAVAARLPADALEADDSRFLAVEVRDEIKVLLLDGRPGRELFTGQADFLAAALKPNDDPAAGRVSPVGLRVLSPAAAEAENVSGEDLVILAGVTSLPGPAVRRLESCVRAGGAVLVFVPPDLDVELYNREYWRDGAGFLAAPLGAAVKPETPVGLNLAASEHPATRHLRSARYGDASLGRVERYHSLLPAAAGGSGQPPAVTVLQLADGAPYLVERALGRGRTLLCTTTAGADWNDLAARPFYAPLMHELLRHVAGRPPGTVTVGSPWSHSLPAEEAGQSADIAPPAGGRRSAMARGAEAGGAVLTFDETTLPGIYTVDLGRAGCSSPPTWRRPRATWSASPPPTS
jgi:hypothetical protein